MANSNLILEERPSWLNFVGHFVLGGIGLLLTPIMPLFIFIPIIAVGAAIWQWAALVLRLYDDGRVVLEKGVLAKQTKELYGKNIRTVDVQQSLIQRMFGIGDLMIATAGTAGYEDVAKGMQDPAKIKDKVINQGLNE